MTAWRASEFDLVEQSEVVQFDELADASAESSSDVPIVGADSLNPDRFRRGNSTWLWD